MSDRTMRWKCEDRGCFMDKHVPDLTIFDDCFGGKMSMGDMDGWIEVNYHYLLMELKSGDAPLPLGQRIMFERLTRRPEFTVLVINVDNPSWNVHKVSYFKNGLEHIDDVTTIDELHDKITQWHDRVKR